jgi:hypothetical protein
VMRQLREAGLCDSCASTVEIYDRRGLEKRGDFDPQYLYLAGQGNASYAAA